MAGALSLKALSGNEEPDSTFTKIPVADLPQRPMFLFVHLEKSAGSFLAALFGTVVGANELGWHYPSTSVHDVPDSYFVVSSIRNPCSQVLSAWSYCCEKAWTYEELDIWDSASKCGTETLHRGECPKFSGQIEHDRVYSLQVEDVNAAGLESSLRWGKAGGWEKQFNKTFGEIGPDRVNCWVRLESLEQDVRKCLQEYEQFSGYSVDWAALDGKFGSNAGHHNSCQSYYTRDAEQLVRRKNAFLFDYFGYDACCDSQ